MPGRIILRWCDRDVTTVSSCLLAMEALPVPPTTGSLESWCLDGGVGVEIAFEPWQTRLKGTNLTPNSEREHKRRPALCRISGSFIAERYRFRTTLLGVFIRASSAFTSFRVIPVAAAGGD